jgi:protein TonB
MSAWRERSYQKALGVSLGIHGLLLGVFLGPGQPAAGYRDRDVKPLAVAIVPSRVLEMGNWDWAAGADWGESVAAGVVQVPHRGLTKEPASAVSDAPKPARAAVVAAPAPAPPNHAAASDTAVAAPSGISPEAAADLALNSRVTGAEAKDEPGDPGATQAGLIAQGDNVADGTAAISPGPNDGAGAGHEVGDNLLAKAGERMAEAGEGKTSGLLKGAAPRYPAAARKAGWEGLVVARVRVDTRGRAASVFILESSGYPLLDQAVTRAVRKWIFTPATQAGKAIDSFHDVKVRFRLADRG